MSNINNKLSQITFNENNSTISINTKFNNKLLANKDIYGELSTKISNIDSVSKNELILFVKNDISLKLNNNVLVPLESAQISDCLENIIDSIDTITASLESFKTDPEDINSIINTIGEIDLSNQEIRKSYWTIKDIDDSNFLNLINLLQAKEEEIVNLKNNLNSSNPNIKDILGDNSFDDLTPNLQEQVKALNFIDLLLKKSKNYIPDYKNIKELALTLLNS